MGHNIEIIGPIHGSIQKCTECGSIRGHEEYPVLIYDGIESILPITSYLPPQGSVGVERIK